MKFQKLVNNKKKWLKKPILICGFERSGTNLLVSLLDNHPNLVVYSEGHLHLFSASINMTSHLNIYKKIKYFLSLDTFKRIKLNTIKSGANILKPRNKIFDFNIFKNEIKKVVKTDQRWTDLIELFFYAYNKAVAIKKNDSKILGFVESTPGNENFSEIFFSLYPQGKTINMIRDPQSVWSSWKEAGKGRSARSIWKFISLYNQCLIKIFYNQAKFGKAKCLLVNYDNLVSSSKANMKKIAKFLKIPFYNSMLKPTKLGIQYFGNSLYGDKFLTVSNKSKLRYKEKLSKTEILLIKKYCIPIYKKLNKKSSNYKIKLPSISIFDIFNLYNSLCIIKETSFKEYLYSIAYTFYTFRKLNLTINNFNLLKK